MSLFKILLYRPKLVLRSYAASNKVCVLLTGRGDAEIVGVADNDPEGRAAAIALGARLSDMTGIPFDDQRPGDVDGMP